MAVPKIPASLLCIALRTDLDADVQRAQEGVDGPEHGADRRQDVEFAVRELFGHPGGQGDFGPLSDAGQRKNRKEPS